MGGNIVLQAPVVEAEAEARGCQHSGAQGMEPPLLTGTTHALSNYTGHAAETAFVTSLTRRRIFQKPRANPEKLRLALSVRRIMPLTLAVFSRALVCGAAALPSPESLGEKQNLRSHSRPHASDPRQFVYTLRLSFV